MRRQKKKKESPDAKRTHAKEVGNASSYPDVQPGDAEAAAIKRKEGETKSRGMGDEAEGERSRSSLSLSTRDGRVRVSPSQKILNNVFPSRKIS